MRRTNFLVTVNPKAPSRGGLMDKPSDYLNVWVMESIVLNAWWNPEKTRRGLMYAPAG
jgi:hypothetical protein